MKSLLKVAFVSIFVLALVGMVAAQPGAPPKQILPNFNPPPCDFSDQFYSDNGLDSSPGGELNTEADGRFGSFRQTGPPASGSQLNWVNDSNCPLDPTRRNVRILAATGGNADDGNSPFSCQDVQNGVPQAVPQCPPPNGTGSLPASFEFISILAFLHNQKAFIGDPNAQPGPSPNGGQSVNRTVGFINGGLEGVQQNPGETIAINPGQDPNPNSEQNVTGLNPRGISMQFIVSNFEAYASIDQFNNTLQCPQGANATADPTQCTPAPGHFANAPCSVQMINNLQAINDGTFPRTTLPQFCFNVADTHDSQGHTHSDVETPKLRQDWRFATNRNAMDGSDNNSVGGQDSPFGYFCDDLLGMWIITYFWFTSPPNDPTCGQFTNPVGKLNGFTPDGFPIILTADELNNVLEGNACGAEGKEDTAGGDNGAVWLVCPALQDPRNGAIASDAFLDFKNTNTNIDISLFNQFNCLQKKGKFCFENSTVGQ